MPWQCLAQRTAQHTASSQTLWWKGELVMYSLTLTDNHDFIFYNEYMHNENILPLN